MLVIKCDTDRVRPEHARREGSDVLVAAERSNRTGHQGSITAGYFELELTGTGRTRVHYRIIFKLKFNKILQYLLVL